MLLVQEFVLRRVVEGGGGGRAAGRQVGGLEAENSKYLCFSLSPSSSLSMKLKCMTYFLPEGTIQTGY